MIKRPAEELVKFLPITKNGFDGARAIFIGVTPVGLA